jgi:hypothetical protein
LSIHVGLNLHAQENKRNNNWVVGHAPAVIYNFNNGLSIQNSFLQVNGLKSGTNISDKNGNLLFYSTGFFLVDNQGIVIANGDKVNSPYGTLVSDITGGGSPYEQTSIILPKKGNQYYVFSTGISDTAFQKCQQNLFCVADVLNYCVVDMDSNAGKGKVVLKNKVILDNQTYTNLATTAVRHGNGVDWWLVKVDCFHKQIQTFWVQADTILGPYFHPITDTANYSYIRGQLYFSPDGSKFACMYYNNLINGVYFDYNRVDLFDFNRCSGQFSFRNYYEVPNDTSNYPSWDTKMGICFSPDSKLLYMSTFYNIFQIDIEDTNKQSALFIHGPDTSLNYFPMYHTMACGPDGRLYIGNFNGTRQYMSYIEYPNVKGLGCNFVPQGLWQPYTNLLTPPNMPNYGLGVDTANGCWPLSLPNPPKEGDEMLVVYPNPASTSITISCEALKGKRIQVILFNILGQEVLSQECHFVQQKSSIDVSNFPRGVYLLKVGEWVRRVVVE